MRVQQLSVFLENKPGRLAAVTKVLGEAHINMRALCLADTSDFGVLRLIVTDPAAAVLVLKAAGFVTRLTDVIAVEVPDRPGGLSHIMEALGSADVSVEYLYAFTEKFRDNALVIFRVEDIDKAVDTLAASGVQVVPSAEVYAL
ncbi:MAG TPA: ACT domain-containing protein [Armatimonadota bacterium]